MTKRRLQRTDACQMPCWSDSPPGPIKKKLTLVTPEKLNRVHSECFSVAQTKPIPEPHVDWEKVEWCGHSDRSLSPTKRCKPSSIQENINDADTVSNTEDEPGELKLENKHGWVESKMVNGKLVSTCSGCKVDGADQTEPEDDVTVSPLVEGCYSSDELSVSSEEPVTPSEDVYNKSGYDSEDMSCWDAYCQDSNACWDKFWADTRSSLESESPSVESESSSVRLGLTDSCSDDEDDELKWDPITQRWYEPI